jgi:hypothetical protein
MTEHDTAMYEFIEDMAFNFNRDKKFKRFYDINFYKNTLVREIVQIHLDNLYTFQNDWKEITEDVYEPINIISYDDIDRFETYFFTGLSLSSINSFNQFVKPNDINITITNTDNFIRTKPARKTFVNSDHSQNEQNGPVDQNGKMEFDDQTIEPDLLRIKKALNATKNNNSNRQDTFKKRRIMPHTYFPGGYKKNKTKKYYKKNKTKKYYKKKLHKKYIKK